MTNLMHHLRQQGVRLRAASGPVTLTVEEAQELGEAVAQGLSILDTLWETAAGRKLTDAEKGVV